MKKKATNLSLHSSQILAVALLHQGRDLHGELMGTAELVDQNFCALGLAQVAPVRHFDQEPEAIG